MGGPTSFRKFKDEAAHPYGGSPLKSYPGPPYTSGTEEAREVEMNAPGGSTPGLHFQKAQQLERDLCSSQALRLDRSCVHEARCADILSKFPGLGHKSLGYRARPYNCADRCGMLIDQQ